MFDQSRLKLCDGHFFGVGGFPRLDCVILSLEPNDARTAAVDRFDQMSMGCAIGNRDDTHDKSLFLK